MLKVAVISSIYINTWINWCWV